MTGTASSPVGVVLAGGSSRRLGRDKTLLLAGDKDLLEHTRDRLAEVCAEVLIADRGRRGTAGSIPDGPGRGPAAGILGAAAARPGRPLLVLACDLPNVPTELLAHLAAVAQPDSEAVWDWVVPAVETTEPDDPRYETLCSWYGPRTLQVLAAEVEAGRYSLQRVRSQQLRIRPLYAAELRTFGDPETLFLNLNTEEDVAAWLRR